MALWLEEPAFALDAEVKTAIETFAADLAAQGALVEPVKSPVDGDELIDVYLQLLYHPSSWPTCRRPSAGR